MAVVIPQVVTGDRASGAQFIEGSLKFDSSKSQYLQRTPTATGNRKKNTVSFWVKRSSFGDNYQRIFNCDTGAQALHEIVFNNDSSPNQDNLVSEVYISSQSRIRTSAILRDTGWYHIVVVYDSLNSTQADRQIIYINGERQSINNSVSVGQIDGMFSSANEHRIGNGRTYQVPFNGSLSQFYFLDGIAAGPEEFGYTDPLTNTWRPKKYSGSFTQSSVNDGTTWSSSVSGPVNSTKPLSLCFGGTIGSGYQNGTTPTGGNTLTLDISSKNLIVKNVRLNTFISLGPGGTGTPSTFTVNGNTVPISGQQDQTHVVAVNGQLNTIEWSYDDGNGPYVYMRGIEVDLGGGLGYELLTDGVNSTGINSFYLPMDGNSPIGKDQSGNGNDWTPVAFGGSVDLPKATGAIPILNTNEAGTVAKKGVRTDKKTYTVTASGGNYYLDGALKPTLNAYRGGSYTFDYTGATSHPFYLSSLPDGKHNSKAYSTNFDGNDTLRVSSTNIPKGNSARTIDFWVWIASGYSTWSNLFAYGSGSDSQCFGINIDNAQTGEWSFTGYSTGDFNTGVQVAPYVDKWTHVAVTYAGGSGGALKIYLNGSLIGSTTKTLNTTGSTFCIGGSEHSGFGENFTGYIADFRVTSGVLYTDNFTPPNTSITTTSQGATASDVALLCCQNQTVTTAVKTPDTISVGGDPSGNNTYHPYLYNNVHGNFGLNTATSNTTKITIPHTAADTLYYYCNAHSGMGSSINVTTDIFKADPYAWKCMFAMASDTVDHSPEINVNSTASIFGDIHTTTLQGSRNFYGHSKKMESGGGFRIDMELTTAEANAKHKFDNNDFTLECWHYNDGSQSAWHSLFRSAAYNNPSGTGGTGIAHYGYSQALHPYSVVSGNGQNWGATGNIVPYKKWHHTAWTRQGNVNRIFANGILVKTFTNSNSWDNRGWEIGDVHTWSGGYQDARIYNGVAKYTENFVVGSTAPDILPDTPSGITSKTNLTKITEGAVAFNGTGDYLTVPGSTDLQMGTGDFTIECYFNVNGAVPTGCWRGMISLGGFTTDHGITIYAPRASSPVDTVVVILNRVNPTLSSTINVKHGWHHVALVRNSGTTKLYVNGIEQSSISDTTNYDYSGAISIGRDPDCTNTYYEGFISNLRVVKGTALYTSEFTPPTEPLTAVTNTTLLCCQSSTSATAAAVTPGTISTSGSPSATNFNPFTDDINAIRGKETGYATWNPLTKGSRVTLSNGNLDIVSTASSGQAATMEVLASIGTKSGKYYVEWTNVSNRIPNLGKSTYGGTQLGVYSGGITNSLGGSVSGSSFSFTSSDVIALAVDFDNKIAYVYKNNDLQYTANYTTDVELFFKDIVNGSGSGGTSNVNFGQKPFKFPPPDGFQPLSLSNIQPEEVIARPDQYVQANIWSGDNTTRNFDIGMEPDFVWVKCRSDAAGHRIFDSVRGPRNSLRTSSTNGQDTVSNFGYVSSFNNNGFTLTPGGYTGYESGDVNMTGRTYVGWTWKAGGSKGTFNVDDVGYANASDVNMSAGALNNVLYDMSDVWSSRITGNIQFGPATNLFDGEITASVIPQDNSTLTWTPLSAITGTIRIRMEKSGNDLVINGVNVNAPTNPVGHWYTYSGNSITSIQWGRTDSASQVQLFAIEVNGKLLRDSNMPSVPSIAATGCSVGTKQGFSIVKFTGNSTTTGSIAHGLNKKPQFVIVKDLVNNDDWQVKFVDENRYLKLNGTDTGSTSYGNYTATDSLIKLGYTWNNDSSSHIAYSWHDVPGLQKFGTYEGNTTEGAFVELGFRPAIIWIKSIDQTWYWNIHDSKRGPINPIQGNFLRPDQTYVEGTASGNNNIDFLSNGFKIRSTTAQSEPTNVNGQTYFYAAWAEAPSINLYGGQSNAR